MLCAGPPGGATVARRRQAQLNPTCDTVRVSLARLEWCDATLSVSRLTSQPAHAPRAPPRTLSHSQIMPYTRFNRLQLHSCLVDCGSWCIPSAAQRIRLAGGAMAIHIISTVIHSVCTVRQQTHAGGTPVLLAVLDLGRAVILQASQTGPT